MASLVAMAMLSRVRAVPGYSLQNCPSSCSLRPLSRPVPTPQHTRHWGSGTWPRKANTLHRGTHSTGARELGPLNPEDEGPRSLWYAVHRPGHRRRLQDARTSGAKPGVSKHESRPPKADEGPRSAPCAPPDYTLYALYPIPALCPMPYTHRGRGGPTCP